MAAPALENWGGHIHPSPTCGAVIARLACHWPSPAQCKHPLRYISSDLQLGKLKENFLATQAFANPENISEPQTGIEPATSLTNQDISQPSLCHLSLGSSMVRASHRRSEGCGFDSRLGLRNIFWVCESLSGQKVFHPLRYYRYNIMLHLLVFIKVIIISLISYKQ